MAVTVLGRLVAGMVGVWGWPFTPVAVTVLGRLVAGMVGVGEWPLPLVAVTVLAVAVFEPASTTGRAVRRRTRPKQ